PGSPPGRLQPHRWELHRSPRFPPRSGTGAVGPAGPRRTEREPAGDGGPAPPRSGRPRPVRPGRPRFPRSRVEVVTAARTGRRVLRNLIGSLLVWKAREG